jgi:CRISPR-associated protein Cmr2
MAAMPLKKRLEARQTTAATGWQAYLKELPDRARDSERAYHGLKLPILNEYDGSLLFASRLLDHLKDEPLRRAQRALRAFLDEVLKDTGFDEPIPYYALLAGDGDFMGKAIEQLATDDENRNFSRVLSGFAAEAGAIIGKHDGAVVFAGGDDVLALLPLHTAVDCAAELARTFRDRLKAFGAPGKPPTFSAGLAIVHHLEPLEDALALARRAEEKAKALDGKNALAVALDKRSGVPRLVVGHWDEIDVRLGNLAALHRDEVIPDRLAYQLLDVYHRLGGEAALREEAALRDVLGLEAERIIERKRETGGQDLVKLAHKTYVKEAISHADTTVATVADELVIAALLAKAGKLADRPYQFKTQEATK